MTVSGTETFNDLKADHQRGSAASQQAAASRPGHPRGPVFGQAAVVVGGGRNGSPDGIRLCWRQQNPCRAITPCWKPKSPPSMSCGRPGTSTSSRACWIATLMRTSTADRCGPRTVRRPMPGRTCGSGKSSSCCHGAADSGADHDPYLRCSCKNARTRSAANSCAALLNVIVVFSNSTHCRICA